MKRTLVRLVPLLFLAASPVAAQTLPQPNPTLERIWRLGNDSSQLQPLAQVLLDSLGPRLNGSPAHKAANDWMVKTYGSWGITARNEQYGTWRSWRRGITHLDLLQPGLLYTSPSPRDS
jgi:carboxypeptidase Q